MDGHTFSKSSPRVSRTSSDRVFTNSMHALVSQRLHEFTHTVLLDFPGLCCWWDTGQRGWTISPGSLFLGLAKLRKGTTRTSKAMRRNN
jgi:hypothetical protein